MSISKRFRNSELPKHELARSVMDAMPTLLRVVMSSSGMMTVMKTYGGVVAGEEEREKGT
jgi:hypothetical protein